MEKRAKKWLSEMPKVSSLLLFHKLNLNGFVPPYTIRRFVPVVNALEPRRRDMHLPYQIDHLHPHVLVF
jgi:hypothetical protein